MTAKNGQSKTIRTKPATRTVHVAIPLPTFNLIRKMAAADDRSINYKIGALIEQAAHSQETRRQYRAQTEK